MIDAYEFCRGIKVLLLSEMPPCNRPNMQAIRCVALDSCALELFGAPMARLREFAMLIKTHLLEFHRVQQITTSISYHSGGIMLRWDSVPETNSAPSAMVIQITSFRHFRTKPRAPQSPQQQPRSEHHP